VAGSGLSYGSRSLAIFGIMLLAVQQYYPSTVLLLQLGETASWLLVLMGGALAVLLVWPVAEALRRVKGGSLHDLVQAAFGRPGTVVHALLLAAALLLLCAITLRQTSEMALTANFPHTPQTVAVVTLLGVAIPVAATDQSALVRAARLTVGPVIAGLVVIMVGTVGWGTPGFLAPFWGPGPLALLQRTPAATFHYAPLGVVYALADGVADRKKLLQGLLLVPAVGAVIYAAAKANLLMIYSYPTGITITFPVHQAARLVIGGRFFERIEGLWLFIWVMGTIAFIAALLHVSTLTFTRAFGIKSHRTALLPMAAVVLTLAYIPVDQAQTLLLTEAFSLPISAVTLGLPVLCAAVAAVRGRLR
jgi:spore germination protein KB